MRTLNAYFELCVIGKDDAVGAPGSMGYSQGSATGSGKRTGDKASEAARTRWSGVGGAENSSYNGDDQFLLYDDGFDDCWGVEAPEAAGRGVGGGGGGSGGGGGGPVRRGLTEPGSVQNGGDNLGAVSALTKEKFHLVINEKVPHTVPFFILLTLLQYFTLLYQ